METTDISSWTLTRQCSAEWFGVGVSGEVEVWWSMVVWRKTSEVVVNKIWSFRQES